jgi:hypothetical protein
VRSVNQYFNAHDHKNKPAAVGPKTKQLLEPAPARRVGVLPVVLSAVMGYGILAALAWFLVGPVMRS